MNLTRKDFFKLMGGVVATYYLKPKLNPVTKMLEVEKEVVFDADCKDGTIYILNEHDLCMMYGNMMNSEPKSDTIIMNTHTYNEYKGILNC